jgi:hypothetical protein
MRDAIAHRMKSPMTALGLVNRSLNATLLVLWLVAATALAQPAKSGLGPEDPGRRIRLGFSFDGGLHLLEPMGVFGTEAHIGFQVTNVFGVFGVVGGKFGFGAAGSQMISGYLATLAELFFLDVFYVAAGPALGVTSISTRAFSTTGPAPGVDLRFGIGIGRERLGWFGRGGLNLGLDAMLLFHPSVGLSFVPMVQVGYEWR